MSTNQCQDADKVVMMYEGNLWVGSKEDTSCGEYINYSSNEFLDLSYRNIVEVQNFPTSGIKGLNLRGNRIKQLIQNDEIDGNFSLDLSQNPIESFNDIQFPVTSLNVAETKISSFNGLNSINLYYLNISQLPNMDVSDIVEADSLEELRWRDASLDTLKGIKFPSSITILDFRSNFLRDLDDVEFPPALNELWLGNNQFEKFPFIPAVELEFISFRESGMKEFNTIPLPTRLKTLSLISNNITSIYGVDFTPMLQTISLEGNEITNFEIRERNLVNFNKAKYLTIKPVNVKCENPNAIKKKIRVNDNKDWYTLCVISDDEFDQLYAKKIDGKKKDQPSSSVTTKATIAIIVAAVLGGLLLICIIGFVFWRKKKKIRLDQSTGSNEPMENSKTPSTDNAVAKYSLMQDSTVSHIYTDPLISSARIPFDKLKVGECIAKGGFGEVYKGTYKGRIVAIKRLLLESRKDMKHIQAFIAEIRLMAFMEHPNIVQFIGVAWDALSDLSAVTEFMYQGDLRTLLLKYERLGYQHGFNREKIKIVCDIAKGLTYLHSLNPVVVHRDLKSRNVLLDKNLIAKLTDFGVSRESVDHTMTAGVGTGLWMAPEVMTGERYNEKADIFSFGVLLSEIDTHSIPYSHAKIGSDGRTIADTALMQMIVMGKLQVQFSQEAQADIVDVGLSCLSLDPALRPTAPEVSYRMIKVFKTIPR